MASNIGRELLRGCFPGSRRGGRACCEVKESEEPGDFWVRPVDVAALPGRAGPAGRSAHGAAAIDDGGANPPLVDALGKCWGKVVEGRPHIVEQAKPVERYKRSPLPDDLRLVRTDPDPRHLARDVMPPRLCPQAADADNCVVVPGAVLAHAVVDAETASRVRVTHMRSLVHEHPHTHTP